MVLLNSSPHSHIRHHHNNRSVAKISLSENHTVINELINVSDSLPFLSSSRPTLRTALQNLETLSTAVAQIFSSKELDAIHEMNQHMQANNWTSQRKPDPINNAYLGATSHTDHVGPLDTNYTAQTNTFEEFQTRLYGVIVPLMLVFCILSSIINLVIVLSARWCRKPMSPTLYFSISLALADAFASIILGIGLVINSLIPDNYYERINACFPLALEAFRLGGVLVAVTHLLALAINHWMGIVRPLQYEATMTRGTALRVIIMAWICPISMLLLYFSSVRGQGFQSDGCKQQFFLFERLFRSIFASFFFAPLILMTLIYGHIFIIVRNHLHYRLKYQHQSCLQFRRNLKAVVTTVLILGTYIVGWMPAVLLYIIVCDDCVLQGKTVPREISTPISIIANILIILKAFVDPIIYAARMTDIQMALKKMRYDFFLWLFEYCAPPRSPHLDRHELGSVRFTKSFHMSSRGSSFRSNV